MPGPCDPPPGGIVLFPGLEGDEDTTLPHLRRAAARPEDLALVRRAADGVETAFRHHDPGPEGWRAPRDLEGLVSGTVQVEPERTVAITVAAHVHQLLRCCPRGRDRIAIGPGTALVGHSIGLWAALVAGTGCDSRPAYLARVRGSVAYVTLMTLRVATLWRRVSGDVAGPPGPDRPTPMLVVRGPGTGALRELLAGLPATVEAPGGEVPTTMGVVNGPRASVVTGHPTAMAQVREAVTSRYGRRALTAYMQVGIPFHNPVLAPVTADPGEAPALAGYPLTAGDLRVPVHVNHAPHDLRLRDDMPVTATWSGHLPVDLPELLARAAGPGAGLVNAGPGGTVHSLARAALAALPRTEGATA